MDDNGNEPEWNGDTEFRLTPKGLYIAQLMQFGATRDEGSECWSQFEAFCIKLYAEQGGTAAYTALVFDGEGGDVMGVECEEVEEETE